MTQDLGFYTGWAVSLVLVFLLPLMIAFIEYLRRVNRKLRDIQDKLSSLPDSIESVEERKRNTNSEYPAKWFGDRGGVHNDKTK